MTPHCRYVLRLADTHLVLAQRLGEWVGHAPALEEDLGLANVALDLLGQARLLLAHAGELEGRGRGEDELAYLREESEFLNLTLVEQPIRRDDIEGLARIRRGIGIPLMADESVSSPAALVEIIRREAADLVKLKVMKQGGLLRTLALVECARAAGLRVVLGHGFGLTLSTLAEAAVAAVSDAVLDGCEAVGPLKMAGDVVVDPVRLDDGVIRLPDTPGLGATIDPDLVKRHRVAR